MKLIVGLGNPGEEYKNTRHNIGFMVLDKLLEDLEPLKKTFWDKDKYSKSELKKIMVKDKEVLLVKPMNFMNNSGFSVQKLSQQFEIPSENIYVVYDDLDLPMGKIRVRMGGAAGGHRGTESIINALSSDKFLRIRLGIGRPTRHDGSQRDKSTVAVDEYVLASFTPSEKSKVRTMTNEAIKILKTCLSEGIDVYMSKFNKK